MKMYHAYILLNTNELDFFLLLLTYKQLYMFYRELH